MSIPSVGELEDAAKAIVRNAREEGTLTSLTVRIVREKVEEQYDLEPGTLDDEEYRKPLKAAVTAATNEPRAEEDAPARSSSPEERKMAIESARETSAKPTSSKKRRRSETKKEFKSAEFIESSGAEDDGGAPSVIPAGPFVRKPKIPSTRKPKILPESEGEEGAADSSVEDEPRSSRSDAKAPASSKKETRKKNLGKTEKKEKGDAKAARKEIAKGKGKPKEELSKDEVTIKRLKSVVTACGVRKIWSKVFQDCDRPSQQIKKLKEILAELGMTGRYSLEQAKRIKEKREFAQELEDVKSFERSVTKRGKAATPQDEDEEEEEEEEENLKPTKRKRTALQSITAFLEDQSDDD